MSVELQKTALGRLIEMAQECAPDYIKAKEQGTKAASSRVRKKMLAIRDLIVPIRKEMLDCRDVEDK